MPHKHAFIKSNQSQTPWTLSKCGSLLSMEREVSSYLDVSETQTRIVTFNLVYLSLEPVSSRLHWWTFDSYQSLHTSKKLNKKCCYMPDLSKHAWGLRLKISDITLQHLWKEHLMLATDNITLGFFIVCLWVELCWQATKAFMLNVNSRVFNLTEEWRSWIDDI